MTSITRESSMKRNTVVSIRKLIVFGLCIGIAISISIKPKKAEERKYTDEYIKRKSEQKKFVFSYPLVFAVVFFVVVKIISTNRRRRLPSRI